MGNTVSMRLKYADDRGKMMDTKTDAKGSTDQIRTCWFVGGLLTVIGALLVLRGMDGDASLLVGGLVSAAGGVVALLIAVVATAVRIGSNAARR